MKKRSIKKIILIVLLSVFLIHGVLWTLNYNLVFKKFEEAIELNGATRHNFSSQNGYSYFVAPPTYPQFTGNLSVCMDPKAKLDEKPVLSCDLIIWPSLFSETTILLSLDETEYKTTKDGYSTQTRTVVSFFVDKNCNIIGDYTVEDKKLFKENKDMIEKTFNNAKKFFDF